MKNLSEVKSLLKYNLYKINKCEICGVKEGMSCIKCYIEKHKIDLRKWCINLKLIEYKTLEKWSDDELLELLEIEIYQKYKDYLDNNKSN